MTFQPIKTKKIYEEIMEQIRQMIAQGTLQPGDKVLMITSAGQTMVYTGDLAHHHILLLQRPMWEFSFDTDPKLSAQTRSRMLDRLATDRHAVLSYHFPWPGLGHVRREGEGFAWVPTPTNVTTLG